eukprot:gene1704-biopygen2246
MARKHCLHVHTKHRADQTHSHEAHCKHAFTRSAVHRVCTLTCSTRREPEVLGCTFTRRVTQHASNSSRTPPAVVVGSPAPALATCRTPSVETEAREDVAYSGLTAHGLPVAGLVGEHGRPRGEDEVGGVGDLPRPVEQLPRDARVIVRARRGGERGHDQRGGKQRHRRR